MVHGKQMKKILYIICGLLICGMMIIDYNRTHRPPCHSYYEWLKQYADSDSSIYQQLLRYESALNMIDSV